MKKTRICFLGLDNLPVLAPQFSQLGVGGEQVQHTLLARALARRGHPTSMVVYDYGQADHASWDRIVTYRAYRQQAGIPVLRFIHPRFTGIWSALQRADADVYYVSCAGMHLGLAVLFCRRYGRRVVFRVAHDADCDPSALLVTYWRDRKFYEYGLRRADAILVQSRRQQQALLVNYGLLWVNNLRAFKRPELLLALAARLPALRFHMIGGTQPGEQALFERIRNAAAGLPNLRFHGAVPYQQMDDKYGRARLFVNTSASEGFPNSFLQAWIRGTPVISFFDPDGLIRRERLGAAVQSLDDMVTILARHADDDAVWSQTSQRCTDYMQRTHHEDTVLAPYLKLFRETC